jgi:hypothetical protein
METLNDAFFFVIDIIVDLQAYFIALAWDIGKTVLFIALATAAVNYALTGEGLKSNIIKTGKAAVFFIVIMAAYPRIVGHITEWTFDKARDSTYTHIEKYLIQTREQIATVAADTSDDDMLRIPPNQRKTYAARVMASKKVSEDKNPALYFSEILQKREHGNMTYTVIAPAALLEVLLIVAGECFNASENAPKNSWGIPNFTVIFSGLICGFAVLAAGIFAVLEYIIAFLEYMLVSAVGIILFPLSLWEGSRFMSEKFVGALTGFFIKLLFSNICVFLLLYGFMSLAKLFTVDQFTGRPDQIVIVLFVSLLFFYICKSAPGLAQSLLTGTPSLSATGAISAMAGAAGAAAGAAKLAGKAGGAVAGGTAKIGFGAAGMLQQAGAAAGAVKDLGGSKGEQFGAFMSSIGGSAKESAKAGAGDLARSLIGGGGKAGAGGGPGAGAGAGVNRHSQAQKFLGEKNADGTKKTFGEQAASRRAAGTDAGLDYMAKKEAKRGARQEQTAAKQAETAGNAAYTERLAGMTDTRGRPSETARNAAFSERIADMAGSAEKKQRRAEEQQKQDDRAGAVRSFLAGKDT